MDREQEQKVNSPNATTREAMAEARALPTSDKVQIQPTADQPTDALGFCPVCGEGPSCHFEGECMTPTQKVRKTAELVVRLTEATDALIATGTADQQSSAREVISFADGSWSCRCGVMNGPSYLSTPCTHCGFNRAADPKSGEQS
jgi:hypothetical protein